MSQPDSPQNDSIKPASDENVIAEDTEPQNELTKKFTEFEWVALKEFRANQSLAS